MDTDGMSVKEAAIHFAVDEKTIRRRIKDGLLPARKLKRPQGFTWRVFPDEATHIDAPSVEIDGAEYDDALGTSLARTPDVHVDPPGHAALVHLVISQQQELQQQAETIGYLKGLLHAQAEQHKAIAADVHVVPRVHLPAWLRRLLGA